MSAMAVLILFTATEFALPQTEKLWAYQPPKKGPPPEVRDLAWPRNEIDHFVLAELERRGLKPANDANKTVLVRRVFFDLIGLPPTPEEVEAFVTNESPDALARLIEELMARPQFGERWGRHWLDVARYAESVTLRGFIFREAWRYRDYVIEAFNRDLPYDEFVREQLAGDLISGSDLEIRRRRLIATTFLVLGNTNLEEQDKEQLRMDVVDEQLDTIGKAFLAQTLGCARCHDHKFDPIPTADYYALAGILRNTQSLEHANVSNWIEVPLPLEPEHEAEVRAHEKAVANLQREIKELKERIAKLDASTAPLQQPKVVSAQSLPGIVVDDAQAKRVGEWKLSQHSGRYIGEGYLHDLDTGKGEKTLTFHPETLKAGKYEVRLAYSPGENRTSTAPVTVFSADGETVLYIDQKKPPPIENRFVSLGQFRFEQNGQGFVLISNQGTDGHVIADAVQFLPADLAIPPSGSLNPSAEDKANDSEHALLRSDLKKWEAQLKKLLEHGPKRPKAMSVREADNIEDSPIHQRGSVHQLGAIVPRGFLRIATHGERVQISTNESGRRELAEWIASPSNPLTARVMVNRIWHWLFGAGLVRTVDNFGSTGERPSHPELLDFLAVSFMENGWSVKRLIRDLMLSRTYQLSAEPHGQGASLDPDNRLFWRMNRRRLDAECLRDAMLRVSGQMRWHSGGPTFRPDATADYGYLDTNTWRSVYVPAFRNALPELFEAFDFADPSTVTGRRNSSTVAPQALFLLNHPFVGSQARLAAEQLCRSTAAWDEDKRINRVFQQVLGRRPSLQERRIANEFVREPGESGPLEAWTQLYQALFASIDFRYLD